MPTNRTYTGGSIVYFQGDLGDDVYVLQKGRVVLLTNDPNTDEEIKEDVQAGEFFGIRSSLGKYPREETAQAIGKTVLISFSSQEFEQFVLKNTRLVLKMLRVFSKELRVIHRQVRDLLKAGAARDPGYELMNVAESFYRSGNFEHACYAFQKYLQLHPRGPYTDRAKEMNEMANKGHMYPISFPALGTITPSHDNHSEHGDESPNSSLATMFYDALDLLGKKDFPGALENLGECAEWSTPTGRDEIEIVDRANYEIGRIKMLTNDMEGARNAFSSYLKKHSAGVHVKEAIYYLGSIAEKDGDTERAKALYRKVATIPPQDETTLNARKKLEAIH